MSVLRRAGKISAQRKGAIPPPAWLLLYNEQNRFTGFFEPGIRGFEIIGNRADRILLRLCF